MSTTKALGDRGEAVTAQYLRERGYALLASQWRCRYGELDLVARDRDGTICFVEVKLRGGDLDIFWDRQKNTVFMTGPAVTVFDGEIDLADFIGTGGERDV